MFEIRHATREGVKLLIGLYGRSGSGKSMTALLIARGIAGPKGRVCLIDSESGRGSIFADVIPGGYQVIDIEPPFSPDRYREAFEVAEANADVVIIDSMSHAHAGEGGVLDMQEAELDRMAGDNYQKREACKMASWIAPKKSHKKFIGRILRSKCALICCLRGEEKTHMVKDERGKQKVVTDEFSSPIFDPRFLFELLVNFETICKNGEGGYAIARKITHPAIRPLIPGENEQLGIHFGEAIARWAESPGGKPSAAPADKPKAPKARLWAWAQSKGYTDPAAFESWLISESIISESETLAGLTPARIEEVLERLNR